MAHPPLVEALLRPGAYPEPERPTSVDLLETHISWLFLTTGFVYKVKKPVDYGFLDFTSLERRRFYCEEEVRLNRRLSPGVYLGVVEIREAGGRLRIEGDGPTVEYAVRMRRLPADRWLSRLLERGEATPELMRRIARRIAEFHRDAETSVEIKRLGDLDSVRFNTEENFAQTAEFVGVTLSPIGYDAVRAYTRARLEVEGERFKSRARAGHVRDGHGDLHADQICVENGIDFIDCIEFSPRFRCCDVAADLAFTAMDLDYYGHPELTRVLVEEYVTCSADSGLPGLLRFYQCYRAYTRGKVRSFRLRQPALDDRQRRMVVDQAERYFELARRYSRPDPPILLVMTGLMGTGKSTLARALGPRLDAAVLVSDRIRKELSGLTATEKQRVSWGHGIYSPESTFRTYEVLHRRAAERLTAGESAILDASYPDPQLRQNARAVAAESHARFLMLETTCSKEEALARLRARGESGDDPSDGREDLYAAQSERYRRPVEVPGEQVVVADMSGALADTVLGVLTEIQRRIARFGPLT